MAVTSAQIGLGLREIIGSPPSEAMFATPLANLELRAKKLARLFSPLRFLKNVRAVKQHSMLGGGSLPSQKIPTWSVACEPESGSLNFLASQLRQLDPAIMGRVHQGQFLLDLQTIHPRHDTELVTAFERFDRHVTYKDANGS